MKFISDENIAQIEEIVRKSNFLLIDFIERGNKNIPIFEIFIDSAQGVTTEECSILSKKIRNLLEASESTSGNYRLDISSPGVDRSLKFLEQYPKNIGRKLEIQYRNNTGSEKIIAKLSSIEGSRLKFINSKNEELVIDFDKIITAIVLISF